MVKKWQKCVYIHNLWKLPNGFLPCGFKCNYCNRTPQRICLRKKNIDKCFVDRDAVLDHPDPLPIAPLYPNTTDTTFECVTRSAEPKPTSINWYIGGEYTQMFIVPTRACEISTQHVLHPRILSAFVLFSTHQLYIFYSFYSFKFLTQDLPTLLSSNQGVLTHYDIS